ncbi:GGDEF domain-containing protein [Pseudofrankia inefficax]|uniref:Diguanylate cyclase n=1 Tax=Pseudofrankia inefficax (strain DSM 45817 / CECT 9037 / DDB 130130 / EuI1c) TaxID=298654 RepID=E3J473_PSEI1|nr:GGDEF domain-containing protein [Pseudofrankia inefficax]ADP81852.1 diguanylate cyclase [Pseudofrankia inefficax]
MAGLRGFGGDAPGLPRPARSGPPARLLQRAALACVLLVGLAVACTALLSLRDGLYAALFAALAAEVAAAVACLWSARRAGVDDRRWRVLIAVLAGGLASANVITLITLFMGGSLVARTPSVYAGLVFFYGLGLAGLLAVPTYPVAGRVGSGRGPRRWHAVILLDCLLIVGSLVLLEWRTGVDEILRARAPNAAEFGSTLLQQVATLSLAAAVLLIASFRRPRSPGTLALLGCGLMLYALTDSLFVYRVAAGHHDLPPWSLIAYTVSLLLVALAALVPSPAPADLDSLAPPRPRAMWLHAALPYAVLCAAGLLTLGKLATGAPLDRVEAYGMVSLLVLALARQMITIAENTHLLAALRERESQLHYQAFHDPLTGLANRALFTRRLQRAVGAEPGRDGASGCRDGPLSVLFVDLDHFKRVNDAFGHAAGDELLRISAARLRGATRAVDTVARLGGDEFGVILDSRGDDNPRHVAERLATEVQAPCRLAGRTYVPRASLGLVTLDGAARPPDPDTLLHQADLAMYAAKRERAGRLVVYGSDLPDRF